MRKILFRMMMEGDAGVLSERTSQEKEVSRGSPPLCGVNDMFKDSKVRAFHED